MSDWSRQWRDTERSVQREERAALKRQRELAKQRRLQEKLDEQQRARLEADEHAARIEVLLSLHRESGPPWDWIKLSAGLAPPRPIPATIHERRAQRELMRLPERTPEDREHSLNLARDQDRRDFVVATNQYEAAQIHWQKITQLARRILAGDTIAYRDAMQEFSPLVELADLGSSLDFTIFNATTIECVLSMNGTQVIPAENKTLTATGKLSVKAMSRQQFHETYQDYICGGVLRVARESFALLPIQCILVTALAPLDAGADRPVLSVVIERSDFLQVNFERADASETIDRLPHRGDFKASRRAGAFQPIVPYTLAEIVTDRSKQADLTALRSRIKAERAAVQSAQQAIQELSSS